MKDEIKEIEKHLKKCSECFTCQYFLGEDEKGGHCKLINILDYITNLQTIEQHYSQVLSENAELENKITNLQEERNNMACLVNDLQEKIDKAIEYGKELRLFDNESLEFEIGTKFINILQGKSDE